MDSKKLTLLTVSSLEKFFRMNPSNRRLNIPAPTCFLMSVFPFRPPIAGKARSPLKLGSSCRELWPMMLLLGR